MGKFAVKLVNLYDENVDVCKDKLLELLYAGANEAFIEQQMAVFSSSAQDQALLELKAGQIIEDL